MTKVSFYLIEKKPLRRAELACRLSQQILHKHRIWFYCEHPQQCNEMDDFLWDYEPTSFLPHAIDQLQQPICISTQPPHTSFDVCFNFSKQAINPQQWSHTALHVIEIVGHNPEEKTLSREVFKQYRHWGIEPIIHRI